MSNPVVRYSDDDLNFFRQIVAEKIRKTEEQIHMLQSQVIEITENSSDEHGGDWVDDSSINSEVEMLNNMAIRQRKHLQDLQNAILRIRNKSYGICVVTGELIDKKRLIAVPTTTKSLAAKTGGKPGASRQKPPQRASRPSSKSGATPKVISKVIRKNSPAKPPVDEEEEDNLDFDLVEADLGENAPEMEELRDEERVDFPDDPIEENED